MKDPEHRKGISDLEWLSRQPKKPMYEVGDVVEFMEGGYGIIEKRQESRPASYAVTPIAGLPGHPATKYAWFYDLDFKRLVAESSVRRLPQDLV